MLPSDSRVTSSTFGKIYLSGTSAECIFFLHCMRVAWKKKIKNNVVPSSSSKLRLLLLSLKTGPSHSIGYLVREGEFQINPKSSDNFAIRWYGNIFLKVMKCIVIFVFKQIIGLFHQSPPFLAHPKIFSYANK